MTKRPLKTAAAFLVALSSLGTEAVAFAGDAACYTQNKTPSSEPAATIFARAKKEFEAKRFDEAAPRFRDVALNHSKDPNAADAANLYLESINSIAVKLDRMSCYDDMTDDVPVLRQRLCSIDQSQPAATEQQRIDGNNKTCGILEAVQYDIDRLAAQRLVEQGDKAGVQEISVPLYRRAATLYFDNFRQLCQERANSGKPTTVQGCAEVAYNAGRAFLVARDAPKAITAFRALISHDAKTNGKSPLASRAMRDIANIYQAIGVYDLAAEWNERFAQQFPRERDADRALSDAMYLHLATGDVEKATQNTRQFISLFGTKSPTQLGQVVLALASFHADKKDWNATRAILVPNIRFFEKTPPDLRIRAHALLGRAGVNPALEFAKVRSENSLDLEQRVNIAWQSEDEQQRMKRYAMALNAIGEAYFFAAEQTRGTTVASIRMPVYSGSMSDKAAINAYVDTRLKEWFLERSKAIEEAEKAYAKILELRFPPPKWVVLSAARVGFMWADFADAMSSNAQLTTFIAGIQPASLRADVTLSINAMREQLKVKKAKPRLLKCRDLSVKYQYIADDDPRGSPACEAWLAKNFKDEHYGLTEILPALYDTPMFLPRDPLRRDGSIVTPMRD